MILLLVPERYGGAYGAGHWKDLASLRSLLAELGCEHELASPPADRLDEVVERCAAGAVTDLVVYYSFWPELLRRVRERAPGVRLHVRTVNAEALQHWHRAEVRPGAGRAALRSVYGALRLAWRDAQCRRRSDVLLGISEWDDRYYWSCLPGGARVESLPYHSPWPLLRPHVRPLPWSRRESAVLCLAGGRDRIGASMVAGFERLAATARALDAGAGWRFLLSGGVHGAGRAARPAPGVEPLPDGAEPWDRLCAARAVAVLTPLGFGAKTTIADALAAGCHVLVDAALARRLPEPVREHCLVCEPRSPANVAVVLERLAHPAAGAGVHQAARAQALDTLRRALSGAAPGRSLAA